MSDLFWHIYLQYQHNYTVCHVDNYVNTVRDTMTHIFYETKVSCQVAFLESIIKGICVGFICYILYLRAQKWLDYTYFKEDLYEIASGQLSVTKSS